MAIPVEPTLVSLSWGEISKLAFSTGVVTAIVNQAVGWVRDWRKELTSSQRDARYLALRVAVVLESFAIACAKIISDNNTYTGGEECFGTIHDKLPPPPEYPSDVDWKSLPPELSARALSFMNEIPLSTYDIDFMYEIEEDQVSSTCSKHAGKCGYRAWQIAVSMRKQYKLPAFDPKQFAWDLVSLLKTNHDEAFNEKRKSEE